MAESTPGQVESGASSEPWTCCMMVHNSTNWAILASTIGLGATLYQEQDGKDRVIAYASRALSMSESCYPAY